jgi:hypothetical protein
MRLQDLGFLGFGDALGGVGTPGVTKLRTGTAAPGATAGASHGVSSSGGSDGRERRDQQLRSVRHPQRRQVPQQRGLPRPQPRQVRQSTRAPATPATTASTPPPTTAQNSQPTATQAATPVAAATLRVASNRYPTLQAARLAADTLSQLA